MEKSKTEAARPEEQADDKQGDKEPEVKDEEHQSKGTQTLVTGGVINTCVGPIDEWICCWENLPRHPTIAAFGKRRTGKSTSFMNLAQKTMDHIPFGESFRFDAWRVMIAYVIQMCILLVLAQLSRDVDVFWFPSQVRG